MVVFELAIPDAATVEMRLRNEEIFSVKSSDYGLEHSRIPKYERRIAAFFANGSAKKVGYKSQW